MSPILIVGTGYVGLITGTCLADLGHNIICGDIDQSKIDRLNQGQMPIYEPGLEELVAKNRKRGRLSFTTDIPSAVQATDVIFIAVGTPPNEDGSADLQHVMGVAKTVATHMNSHKTIVNKSTVPVGTGKKVRMVMAEELQKRGVSHTFDIVSNPEFLREGSAVQDFQQPDRIIIGTESKAARKVMEKVYSGLKNYPMVCTNLETSETIKYAANAFLATKLAFINEMATLCEAVGANVKEVAKGMGLDKRIGPHHLFAGPGYGGSCFPKDTRAIVHIGKEAGVDMTLVRTTIASNSNQMSRMIQKIEGSMGDVRGKTIGVLGLAFKNGTDDVRESPAVYIARELALRGANVRAYDPIATDNAKAYGLGDVAVYYASSEYDAAQDADGLVVATEWQQFAGLDLPRLKHVMRGDKLIDLRNLFNRAAAEECGFQYQGVGM